MRVFTSIFFIIFFTSFSLGQESEVNKNTIDSNQSEKYKFSIGIDNLPWDISKISFRWWKNRKKGNELSIGYFNEGSTDLNNSQILKLNFGEIRCDWIRRYRFPHFKGFYITRGVGFALGLKGNFSFKKSNEKPERIDSYFSVYFPIGIEHFFLKKYPRLSYSLQADFYGKINYYHLEDTYSDRKFEMTIWTLKLGVKIQFFLRLYLK